MTSRSTVIEPRFSAWIASLSVVKELLFRFHRNILRFPEDLSGGTYLAALHGLAFQLCVSQAAKRPPKIRNPASSAGHMRLILGAHPREARQISIPCS